MRKAVKVEAGTSAAKISKSLISKKNEMPYLPQELLFNILVRLPADKVYEFRRVCRSWYTLIHDPFFIKSHLERSKPGFIVKQGFVNKNVLGSCNGLVLLKGKKKQSSLSIANLITEQRVSIPSTTSDVPYYLDYSYGFTYVPEAGIFKLVHLVDDKCTVTYEVLSLGCSGGHKWRCVNGSSISLSSENDKWQFRNQHPISINGIVHFAGVRLVQPSSIHIVSFDAGAEVVHKIQVPIHDDIECNTFIELGGTLSMVQNSITNNTYSVWILKDWLKGSWEKQYMFSISKPSIKATLHWSDSSSIINVRSSFSHRGRKIIIFERSSFSSTPSHIAYDLESSQEYELQFDIRQHSTAFFTHVNSLFSPKLCYNWVHLSSQRLFS